MFDLRAKRELNHGFGGAYGRGFELVLTPLIFGALGALVDRVAGTHLVFMIGFASFATAGMFVRMWLGYDIEMRRHEQQMLGLRPKDTENHTAVDDAHPKPDAA